MIKTNVTLSSKAKSIPHPQVARNSVQGKEYNDASKKGEMIIFLPKVETNLKARKM